MPNFRYGSSDEFKVVKLPKPLQDFIDNPPPEGSNARNESLLKAAIQARDLRWTQADTEACLIPPALSIGLKEPEIRSTIESAYTRTPREPAGKGIVPHGTLPPGRFISAHRPPKKVEPSAVKYELQDDFKLPEGMPDPARTFLNALFKPGENIMLCRAVTDDDGKETVSRDHQTTQTLEFWNGKLDKKDGDAAKTLFPASSPHGIYFCINPIGKSGERKRDNIVDHRHALIEFDAISKEKQYQLILKSRIPCAAISDSGGKSIHAVVKVMAADAKEYADRVAILHQHFKEYGVDPANKDSTRLSRLPGAIRGDTMGEQRLLALTTGTATFEEWQAEQASSSDELPEQMSIEDMLAFVPSKDPNNLIGDRFLCKGSAFIISGQCLHKDSSIFDPIENKDRKISEIKTDFHVFAKDENGKIVVAKAGAPRIIGHGRTLVVTLASGKALTVAPNHLFWNGSQYQSASVFLEQLRAGERVQLPSISDSDLLELQKGVQSYLQTSADYQDGYSQDDRPCDQRLQIAGAAFQSIPPLSVDVLSHNQGCLLLDDLVFSGEYIRQYQSFGHRSTSRFFPLASPCLESSHRHQVKLASRNDDLSAEVLKLEATIGPRHTDQSPFAFSLASIGLVGFLSSRLNIYQTVQILSITESIECEDWYDFTVPEFHNYVINGVVSHNSGIGKSSFGLQMLMCWCVGRDFFGIKAIRPLKILVVQSENDLGDMAEPLNGIIKGLAFTHAEVESLKKNFIVHRDTSHTGEEFISMLHTLIAKHRPDVVLIDPLLAVVGDDIGEAKVVGKFFRQGLNAMMQVTGVVVVFMHHVPKPKDDKKGATNKDLSYSGSGSSDLTNWPRAVGVLQKMGNLDAFQFIVAKREKRTGMVDEDGKWSDSIELQHGHDGIYWERMDKGMKEAVEADRAARDKKTRGGREEKTLEWVPERAAEIRDYLSANPMVGQNTFQNEIAKLFKMSGKSFGNKGGLQMLQDQKIIKLEPIENRAAGSPKVRFVYTGPS